MKAGNTSLGTNSTQKCWEENLPPDFPPLRVDSGTHGAPKPLWLLKYPQEQGTEIPGVFSPSHSPRETPEPEVERQAQVLARKRKTVFFFQGFFPPLLWIQHVNHEALRPPQGSAEREKRLTHVWRGAGWSFPCCVSTDTSFLSTTGAPGHHCLPASSQGSRR